MEQVIAIVQAICIDDSLHIIFYTATSITVDQLEYSAPLLLVSDVDVNSTVCSAGLCS